MKKWKGSLGAKIAAWVGITISGILCLASMVGAFAIWQGGFYEYASEEACRAELYENVANHYAVRALDNMRVEADDKWQDTSFRYGIIKTDNIDGLDLNDENVYIESNFSGEIDENSLYKVSYEVGDDTYFSYSGTLFGGYSVGGGVGTYLQSSPSYKIIYNSDIGVFYHETSDDFYPVRNVEIGYVKDGERIVFTYEYDFEERMYRNLRYTEIEAESGIEEVLNSAYLTFDMVEGEGFTSDSWNYLVLDGKQILNTGDDIWWVTSEYMAGRNITAETDYEVILHNDGGSDMVTEYADGWETTTSDTQENYSQWINVTYDSADERETYWVVVEMPEDVKFGWSSDLFMQANTLVTLGYGLRYAIYVILFVTLAITMLFFVFLMSAAGHRNDREGIVCTWLDKMPFDVYLGFAFLAELALAVLTVESSYYLDEIPMIVLFAFLIICMCWVALLTCLSFAVRVKCGKWWQNMVIWMIGHLLVDVVRTILINMGLLWKAVLAIGALSVVEFMVVSWDGIGRITMFWMVEKLILVPILLLAIVQMHRLKAGAERMAEGDLENGIDTRKMFWELKMHGETLNSISDGMSRAVDERMKSERFKTELITNVSHDIKTPLTSIINYVDLLEKEDLQNDKAVEYLEVLHRQSARLKKLIEDLMEASKASTGNLAVHLEELEAGVSLTQIVGEFEEKMQQSELNLLISKPEEPIYIQADSRHFWRVVDNLMNNICKYAQDGTRVYIDLEKVDQTAVFTFKNTSKYALNISSEELMERFVRGDSSRNTEGSGLGLSIAKSLMELMQGEFALHVDGDLFKVILKLPCTKSEK